MLDHEESWPFKTTFCFLSFKKSVRVLKRLSDMPFCFNLKIKPLCHTLSKAFDMSKYTNQTSWSYSKDYYIWCIIDRSCYVKESPGLKPNWLGDIKLYSVKNWNMLSYNNISNILSEIGSKEIGWHFYGFWLWLLFFQIKELHWHSERNFLFSKHDRKIIPSGLQIDSSKIFNIWILIISGPWALFQLRFLIIFKISYVENSTDESDLHVFLVRNEESLLLLLTRENCFVKKSLKSSAFFLKPMINLP